MATQSTEIELSELALGMVAATIYAPPFRQRLDR